MKKVDKNAMKEAIRYTIDKLWNPKRRTCWRTWVIIFIILPLIPVILTGSGFIAALIGAIIGSLLDSINTAKKYYNEIKTK